MAYNSQYARSSLAQYIVDELFGSWKKERSPLETKWQRNLENFKGIHDTKWKKGEGEGWRSDTFIGVTKTKVLAAWSMVIDTLLQGGKIPFALKPAPLETLMMKDMDPDQAKEIQNKIEDMSLYIEQQLASCNADRALMKNVLSSALYGETYAKVVIRPKKIVSFVEKNYGEGILRQNGDYIRFDRQEQVLYLPSWEYVSIWDIYRDLETDDLQAGVGVIHRHLVSPFILRQKKGKSLFIDKNIEKAIARASGRNTEGNVVGMDSETLPPGIRDIKTRRNTIEYLEFWGRVPERIAEAFERDNKLKQENPINNENVSNIENDGREVEITCSVAEGEVVRYSRIDPGTRPFFRSVWEISIDDMNGIGVADNVEPIQKVINGAVRAFEDNKKLSANIILGVKKRYIENWKKSFVPGQEIEISEECDDVRKGLQQVVIQDVGQSLLDLIRLFERYADEHSLLPKILQGDVMEKKQPDTAFEMNQLMQNAGKYLGGVIKNHDEGLIEPIVRFFYEYNMDDPDAPVQKGNFIVKALGFTSFQDRVIRVNSLMRFLTVVVQNEEMAASVNFRQIAEEVAKALDLEVSQVLKDPRVVEEEMRSRAEQAQAEAEAQRQLEIDKLKVKGDNKQQELEKRFQDDVLKNSIAGNVQ